MSSKREKLFNLVASVLDVPVESINEDLGIGGISQWDSLAHVRLIMEIETAFEMKIDMEALMEIEDVGDLLAVVEGE